MFKRKLLASVAIAALLVSSAVANADIPGTSTTQTATHADAAAFWIGQSNGTTSCNAVSQTSAQDTITITPGAGQYAYITALLVQFSTDATGATAVPTVSFTNISNNGGSTGPVLSAATTLATTGYHADMVIPFPVGGLKSAQPGVAVTVVPSAAMGAHSILCMSAVGYFNNN